MSQLIAYFFAAIPIVLAVGFAIIVMMMLRVVVSTNDVHIVQSGKHTISYGKGEIAGNVYYRWPAWVPKLGVQVTVLPVSVFNIRLENYAAYDKDRLPFIIDVIGFFRIEDSNTAAQRVVNFNALIEQLKGILQGSIRSILASSEIHDILQGRKEFGEKFTAEVNEQLKQWGVTTVKNVELMDIRDHEDSRVIANIMAMKKSEVESKSRIEVAVNTQKAKEAEIAATQAVNIRDQEAQQAVNIKTVEQQRQTQVNTEQAQQSVAEQKVITAERIMAVNKVNDVRKAEIARDVAVVQAEQSKQVDVVKAEGVKSQTVLIAEGNMEATKRQADGQLAAGQARAESERLFLMAPVSAQLELAKEIGSNNEYQTYLVSIRGIERDERIGVKQAEALTGADVRVIANTGQPATGLKSVMDLFTPQGATTLAAAVEAFSQTPTGEKLVNRAGGVPNDG